MVPQIKDKLKLIEPDVVLADFLSYPFINAADELCLPTIVHGPLPAKILGITTQTWLPMKENSGICCGLVCIRPGIEYILLKYILPATGAIDKTCV